jgi:Protein of unknown function (DUF1360)
MKEPKHEDKLKEPKPEEKPRPHVPYAALASVYFGGCALTLLTYRKRHHELPESFSAADIALLGIATHKISRLITRDKVTAFIRAPFTEFQGPAGHGEQEEMAVGDGFRLAVGELLVCPYCIAQWVAGALTLGLIGAPRLTRTVATIMVVHTCSDFLQLAYRAAEDQV